MNNCNVSYSYNKLMRNLLELPLSRKSNYQLDKKILKIVSDSLCGMKDFGDFLVVQEGNAAEIELGREAIVNKYQDLSGFEHFCNELYFDLPSLDGLTDAIFSALKYTICHLNAYEGRSFCLSLSIDLGECVGTIAMTAHYWQFREGESILDENLDNYNQPMLYARINT